ncbi:DDE_3 domain-containing protein [Trichonephila clavipes]|nr:DDE_3 domain-containing protein [Trichonephila clavipes]
MPLRRNRRQYEQLTDFDRGRIIGLRDAGWFLIARCWQQWITEGRVYRRGGDESRFSLSADDHRTRVWRRTGQRSDPAFIVERHTAISQCDSVGAISWDTRSSLVVLQGTLTARRYVDDILTPIVLSMLSSRPGAIYQQDNARPHTARLSQQCLQDMTFTMACQVTRSFANRTCLERAGKATAAVPRYRRINCADAKTMAG